MNVAHDNVVVSLAARRRAKVEHSTRLKDVSDARRASDAKWYWLVLTALMVIAVWIAAVPLENTLAPSQKGTARVLVTVFVFFLAFSVVGFGVSVCRPKPPKWLQKRRLQ
jgi:uncharacterized membrane protein